MRIVWIAVAEHSERGSKKIVQEEEEEVDPASDLLVRISRT